MEGSESYKRLVKHPQNGKIFLPINIDGLEETDHFTIPVAALEYWVFS